MGLEIYLRRVRLIYVQSYNVDFRIDTFAKKGKFASNRILRKETFAS